MADPHVREVADIGIVETFRRPTLEAANNAPEGTRRWNNVIPGGLHLLRIGPETDIRVVSVKVRNGKPPGARN